MQWQHGKYQKNANGSLTLTPFAVDGRQLVSDPCDFDRSVFTRFHQTELMKVGKQILCPILPVFATEMLTPLAIDICNVDGRIQWYEATRPL